MRRRSGTGSLTRVRSVPTMSVLAVVMLACGSSTSVTTTGSASGSAAGGEEVPRGGAGPFVWEVRGGDAPSYLLGTVHAGLRLDAAAPPHVVAAIDRAEIVVLETDPETLDAEAVSELLARPVDAAALDARLSSDAWQTLVEELELPSEQVARFASWAVMSRLTQKRAIRLAGESAGPPMDLEVLAKARDAQRALRFLETPAAQMQALASVPEEEIVAMLQEMLANPDSVAEELEAMLSAYRSGDADRMSEVVLAADDLAAKPAFYEAVLFGRNDAWRPVLEPLLEEGGAFVAVGVGHLLGPRGIVATLRRDGFDVVRVAR